VTSKRCKAGEETGREQGGDKRQARVSGDREKSLGLATVTGRGLKLTTDCPKTKAEGKKTFGGKCRRGGGKSGVQKSLPKVGGKVRLKGRMAQGQMTTPIGATERADLWDQTSLGNNQDSCQVVAGPHQQAQGKHEVGKEKKTGRGWARKKTGINTWGLEKYENKKTGETWWGNYEGHD